MPAPGGGPDAPHRPVLLQETLRYLAPERGGLFVEATLGLGGHAAAVLEASVETRVLGLDRDSEALRLAEKRLAGYGSRFRAVHANHRDI
ncbi:MAG: 16S rRNA (cytosine(1402)-N(4))-methyltransferase, partial [Pyrinomonadaceae bacterium]